MKDRRSTRRTALFIALFLLGGVLHALKRQFMDSLDFLLDVLLCLIYNGLLLFWTQSLRQRLLPSRARAAMVVSALMMLLFLTLRTIKYSLLPDQLPALHRYVWYAYYIPMLMIPTLFLVSCIAFTREGRDSGPDERWLLLPALLLVLGVLTNDFHRLAFRPVAGAVTFDSADGRHGYGPLYIAAVAWMTGTMVVGIAFLARTSFSLHTWRQALLPLATLASTPALIGLMALLRALGFPRLYELPEIFCFGMLATFEVCIRMRLMPHNEAYERFFRCLRVPAMITDSAFGPLAVTAAPIAADAGQLRAAAREPVYTAPDTRLTGMPIRAGYAFWAEDERELNRMRERLQDANETLMLENDLIRRENEQRAQHIHIEFRNRLYGQMTHELFPTQKRIRALLDAVRPDSPDFRHTVAVCCVMNAYVKRRSNLLLLGHSGPVDSRELCLALEESARALHGCGIEAAAIGGPVPPLPLRTLCDLYDTFEALLEALLPHIRKLTVSLAADGLHVMTDSLVLPELPRTVLPVRMRQSEGYLYAGIPVEKEGTA